MSWRPMEGWDETKAKNAGTAKREMGIEFSDFSPIYEAGANAMLKALKPQLRTIYSLLCGIRIEKGKTEWYSALDTNIDFLKGL